MEIDEPLTAQETIDLHLACPVPTDEAFDRGRLVGGEVVDMHPGMLIPNVHDEIDELLESSFLLDPVECPKCSVLEYAALVRISNAKEVLETAALDKGVGLDIEV